LLDEYQTLRILNILVNGVRDAAGLGSRSIHVLAAECQGLRHAALAGDDASKYDNHDVP
jgi:hypothetical protein